MRARTAAMPRFPSAAGTTGTLSDKVFSQLAHRARERGGYVHPLHVGDTYMDPMPAAMAEAQRSDALPNLHKYAPVQGIPTLLQAVRGRLRELSELDIPTEQIQIIAGATSGISILAATLLDPGDEVILPAPFWPLVRGIVASRGAVPVQVPFFDRLDAPDFDPEATLEAAITPKTTALYVNTPHNPTGRVLPDAVLAAMARVAARHDLWIVCDEAYQDLWYGEAPPTPAWARDDFRDRALACHTLSKSYGLAGARVGYLHGPEEIMQAVRGVQTFQTYAAATPMQYGAVKALTTGHDWLADCRRRYGAAGHRAAEALRIRPPEGGTFLLFDATPYLRDGETTVMPFLERCLDRGVLLTPGVSCGQAYGTWARLCYTSVDEAELATALEKLQPLLQ